MKHFGTDKEVQYDEPEVMDEVYIRIDGKLVKVEGKENDDTEKGQ